MIRRARPLSQLCIRLQTARRALLATLLFGSVVTAQQPIPAPSLPALGPAIQPSSAPVATVPAAPAPNNGLILPAQPGFTYPQTTVPAAPAPTTTAPNPAAMQNNSVPGSTIPQPGMFPGPALTAPNAMPVAAPPVAVPVTTPTFPATTGPAAIPATVPVATAPGIPYPQANPATFPPVPAPRAASTTVSVDPNYQQNRALPGATLQADTTLAAWGEFTNAQIIARVGSEAILAGDVQGMVKKVLEPYKEQLSKEQYEEEKQKLIKQLLEQLIESKMIFADALTKIPKENLEKMQTAVNEQFEKSIVKGMFEKYKVNSRQELQQKLKETGTSLEVQQRMFYERSVAMQWMRQNIKDVDDVPLADVLAYYKNNQASYDYKAQVRWEELMVSFDKIADKAQAYRTIAEWGNQVMQGRPLKDLAKQVSHGPTAFENGQYDWTTEGAIRYAKVNEAIHSLPVGALSQIIEDQAGYHIVRVLERKPAGRVPFEEAQPEIKKLLIEQAQKKVEDEYIAQVRRRVNVWTIYDGNIDPEQIGIKTSATQKK